MRSLCRLLLVAFVASFASQSAADTGDDIKKLLPKPLAGWKQANVVGLKVGQGFRAAGEYRPPSGPHAINVSYQTGAWNAEQMKQQLASPEEARKAGMAVVEIGGRKWLAREGKGGAGTVHTLTTVLDNALVVTVTGFGADRKMHEAYAAAIDAEALGKVK